MYRPGPPGPPPGAGGPGAGGGLKFSINETCDRIKEEFGFLQTQYHSLKLELEKLAAEKTEMQVCVVTGSLPCDVMMMIIISVLCFIHVIKF